MMVKGPGTVIALCYFSCLQHIFFPRTGTHSARDAAVACRPGGGRVVADEAHHVNCCSHGVGLASSQALK
eukprot:935548-Amphidinium_carterae.1